MWIAIALLALVCAAWLGWQNSKLKQALKRFDGIANAQKEAARIIQKAEQSALSAWQESADKVKAISEKSLELKALVSNLTQEKTQLAKDVAALQADKEALNFNEYAKDFGVYQPTYNFDGLEKYKAAFDQLYEQEKQLLKAGKAIECSTEWTVEGSKAKGKRMIEQQLKLMLMAFNGECDSLIAKVRFDNIARVEEKIRSVFTVINKLGQEKQCAISDTYFDLKIRELRLVHEFQERKQAEKEEQRAIAEQMREEERARRELEKAQIDAEREAERYAKALEKARAEAANSTGEKQSKMQLEIERLSQLLAEATAQKERAKSQAELTRSGYVYIISNIGAFGENVYKIGMTRRLDPMDRVIELSDASVPFPFDVHAMIYTEDAPGLENALHKSFHARRLNMVNLKKEFFHVSLDEIAKLASIHKADVHFTLAAEAADWRKSQAIRQGG
jgi:hypothetical protein